MSVLGAYSSGSYSSGSLLSPGVSRYGSDTPEAQSHSSRYIIIAKMWYVSAGRGKEKRQQTMPQNLHERAEEQRCDIPLFAAIMGPYLGTKARLVHELKPYDLSLVSDTGWLNWSKAGWSITSAETLATASTLNLWNRWKRTPRKQKMRQFMKKSTRDGLVTVVDRCTLSDARLVIFHINKSPSEIFPKNGRAQSDRVKGSKCFRQITGICLILGGFGVFDIFFGVHIPIRAISCIYRVVKLVSVFPLGYGFSKNDYLPGITSVIGMSVSSPFSSSYAYLVNLR